MKIIFSELAFILFITVSLSSCKKEHEGTSRDKENSVYYMRFKLNGIQTEFKSLPIAQIAYNTNEKVYVAGLLAYKDSSKTNENLVNIAILSQNPLTNGSEYSDPDKLVSNNTEVPEVILTYYNSQAASFTTMGIFCDSEGKLSPALPDYKNLVADAKVSITTVGINFIKGSFSGTVFRLNSSTSKYDKIPLTDGEFNLRYLH